MLFDVVLVVASGVLCVAVVIPAGTRFDGCQKESLSERFNNSHFDFFFLHN